MPDAEELELSVAVADADAEVEVAVWEPDALENPYKTVNNQQKRMNETHNDHNS